MPRNQDELKQFYESFFTADNYETRCAKAISMVGGFNSESDRRYMVALRSLGLTISDKNSINKSFHKNIKLIHPAKPFHEGGIDKGRPSWFVEDYVSWIGPEAHRHRIACAGLRGKDGYVMACVRHYDQHITHNARNLRNPENYMRQFDKDQGFLDNYNIYWTREEAFIIAKAAGQLDVVDDRVEHLLKGKELFSELLY